MVPAMIVSAFPAVVVDKEKPWTAPLMVALIVAGAISLGYQDAICQYPIARGQRVLVSVVTLGVFTIFYLAAYNVSKRWLLRCQQSGEYRAHPRHQRRYP
jgi:ABC-type branched-subunit amino acid transport system permease subunit